MLVFSPFESGMKARSLSVFFTRQWQMKEMMGVQLHSESIKISSDFWSIHSSQSRMIGEINKLWRKL